MWRNTAMEIIASRAGTARWQRRNAAQWQQVDVS